MIAAKIKQTQRKKKHKLAMQKGRDNERGTLTSQARVLYDREIIMGEEDEVIQIKIEI